ncbi:hypothetical protein SAMN04489712_122103 [Thermomonospora echinospora]|uniref:Uncharacterized protein n=1 Tax=Thermomonospora echinospora TaxID=1992 RepID=A0A1H6DUD6_9ACTN|nr:hypothetical protein SAMN04489712_122103 [Thermomonospora echinospora]
MTENAPDTTLTLSAVAKLLAIEEIKGVFAERLRCMDAKE